MTDISQRPMHERFQHLLAIMSSESFLKMEGLGNEVPFFICPFKPEECRDMSRVGKQLITQLADRGIHVLKINLYDLSISLLQQRGVWDQILAAEETLSKDELKELLQGLLDPEAHLIPAIAERMAERDFDVLFLTGVGEVYPFIRSHTVLNNLQRVAKDRPTVLFFPGEYSYSPEEGASLDLFGRLRGDRYYRAFNIYHSHV
jgi:hypothetical protein